MENENIRIQNLWNGMEIFAGLMTMDVEFTNKPWTLNSKLETWELA